MAFHSAVSTCYPTFKYPARVFQHLSLKHRSLLIKACQGQFDPSVEAPSVLRSLMNDHVTVPNSRSNPPYVTLHLYDLFQQIEKSPEDPLQSAIMIDILRGTPASIDDFNAFKTDGWAKEISLSQTPNTSTVDYTYFFDPRINTPPHPLLPHNKKTQILIYNRFRMLREKLIEHRPLHFSRFTHKNMSDDTRNAFSRSTGIDMSYGAPIFGQDN
jgi:hypothetical protein